MSGNDLRRKNHEDSAICTRDQTFRKNTQARDRGLMVKEERCQEGGINGETARIDRRSSCGRYSDEGSRGAHVDGVGNRKRYKSTGCQNDAMRRSHTKIILNSSIKNQIHETKLRPQCEKSSGDRISGIRILARGDLLGALNCFFPELELKPSIFNPRIPILDATFSLFSDKKNRINPKKNDDTKCSTLSKKGHDFLGKNSRKLNDSSARKDDVSWAKKKKLYSSVLKCSPRKIDTKKLHEHKKLRKDIILSSIAQTMTTRRVDRTKREVRCDDGFPSDANQDYILRGIVDLLEDSDDTEGLTNRTSSPMNNLFQPLPFLYPTSYPSFWQPLKP
ncbi:uncharacterized protein LOC129791091 [Lutzomyia longipalpis]|uniref:uncharacterized protein LOC129791091 n=1 Tax=Lutzomyia longipalpis TaxID=7200 RepID=UPI00248438DE|nr:uncharacterized protein LOC129791091 [Lutzomyia longipalpis]